ncbi:MAG: formylglycine-generating enzyme family protein [Kiritimatiellia bacterium]
MKNLRGCMAMAVGLAMTACGNDFLTFNTLPSATNAVAPFAGDYMIVDLSGGKSATNYPVSWLSDVPVGGWVDEYKKTKMVFRRIPVTTNTFLMGSPEDENGRCNSETQHAVTLTNEFFIGIFEVTQRQWELVMGDRPSFFDNGTYYAGRPVEQVSYEDIRGDDVGTRWPETNAVDKATFLGLLRKKTALATFDLPTEAQWEYACRAGTTTALSSGYNLTSIDSDKQLDPIARYWSNSRVRLRQGCPPSAGTAIVGSYLPNAWGLYDMHGNVWEWCLDWHGIYPGPVTNPPGAVSGAFRVLRGGSWSYGASYCRSAYRYIYGSYDTASSLQCYNFGFRVTLTLPLTPSQN